MEQKQSLGSQAYEPLPEGKEYEPFVPASEIQAEFSVKATICGVLLGILFGAANAYLGLLAGLTISTSIPVAVLTVAAFKGLEVFKIKGTILEANMSQTIGSASSSVASGVIFTLPALFLWNFDTHLIQMTLLALFGGLLGVLFMIPLRRFLIDREHGKLPFPEGTSCAEVLVASQTGGGRAKAIFIGMGIGALLKTLTDWIRVIPGEFQFSLSALTRLFGGSDAVYLKNSVLGFDHSPALFGVGYILGPRIGATMVGGALLSSVLLIPAIAYFGAGMNVPFAPEMEKLIRDMSPDQIWNRYIRYIGAGAVAAAGIIALFRNIPTMLESFRVGSKQLSARVGGVAGESLRTKTDLPLKVVGFGALAVVLGMTLLPQAFSTLENIFVRGVAALLVGLFAFFFVTVSARIVGFVGVTSNPTSGMTIASLLGTAVVFLMMGWTDGWAKVGVLSVGCVVAIAASIAGDTSQDLKTGFLLGATPKKQQIGEIVGVLTSAAFVCATVLLLAPQIQSGELPAPQATLMKLVIDGVLEQSLPWLLVGIGVGITLIAEVLRVPSLPFAVGVYLPLTTMMPVFFGGILRWAMEKTSRSQELMESRREKGILLGSGLVGGAGLLGVLISATAYLTLTKNPQTGKAESWKGVGVEWAGEYAELIGLAAFAIFVLFFYGICAKGFLKK